MDIHAVLYGFLCLYLQVRKFQFRQDHANQFCQELLILHDLAEDKIVIYSYGLTPCLYFCFKFLICFLHFFFCIHPKIPPFLIVPQTV